MNTTLRLQGMLMSPMKSGSTWLSENCRLHPEIYISPSEKMKISTNGIEYFDVSGYNNEPILFGRQNLQLYSFYPQVFFDHNPNMKFICLLREPADRCFSHYHFFLNKDRYRKQVLSNKRTLTPPAPIKSLLFKDVYDFNHDIQKILEQDIQTEIIQKSMYFDNLKPYFDRFPKTNFLIMTLEEVSQNPQAFFDKLSQFLSISNYTPQKATEKINVKFRSRTSIFWKKREIIKPQTETLKRLQEIFWQDAQKLEEYLDITLIEKWKQS